MRAVTAPRDVWGRVMLCPGAGGLRVHCPHREFHPKTKKYPKKISILRHHPPRNGVSLSSHHLCCRLSVWAGHTAEPHLYDGSETGQGGRDLQPGRLQGRGVDTALVGAVVEVLEVRLWSQLVADVANNDADDGKSPCRQHGQVRSCVPCPGRLLGRWGCAQGVTQPIPIPTGSLG